MKIILVLLLVSIVVLLFETKYLQMVWSILGETCEGLKDVWTTGRSQPTASDKRRWFFAYN